MAKYLEFIDVYALIFDLSLAIPYGFACVDMVYEPITLNKTTLFAPAKFNTIHPRFFKYDVEKRLLTIKTKDNAEIDPKNFTDKFLTHFHKTDSGELFDYSIMQKLLYTCLLKHAVITSNMQYFENLGVPPVIVNTATDDEDTIKSIYNQILNLRSNSTGIFDKDTTITLLEGKSTKAEFLEFVRYCDSNISHGVMGNILSSNTAGSSGSFAMSKTHDSRRKDILTFDARLIENAINSLMKVIAAFNFTKEVDIKFSFDTNDEADEKSLAETYKLLREAGYQVPVEHVAKLFRIPNLKLIEQNVEANNIKSKLEANNNTATSMDDDIIEPFIEEISTEKEEKNFIATIDELLENNNSYQEVIDKLLLIYPDVNFNEVISKFETYTRNAYIYGAKEYYE